MNNRECDKIVCHCNVKENAELIAKIMDYDVNSKVCTEVLEIPKGGIESISDGYHTFRDLYYQRMVLFATIVKQNKNLAWKSLRHEDGELCFGGGWFIVGIDTPEGSYTYHYEIEFWSIFDCQELERGKHWDGHTDKDVTRLLSLISKEAKHGEWIHLGGDEWACSECGNVIFTEGSWEKPYERDMFFCNKCGADMREKQNENS